MCSVSVIQSVLTFSIIPLLPCNDWGGVGWGGMRKPKTTCVQLFPTSLKFPISLTGICFGYHSPALEILCPGACTTWCPSSTFLFSIRTESCSYFLLFLKLSISSGFWIHRHRSALEKKITFKVCAHGGLKYKTYLDLLGSRSNRVFSLVVHPRVG